MGYCITMEIFNLKIKTEDVPKALAAINSLSGGAWVDRKPKGGFKSLEDAFTAWRYSATMDTPGCKVDYFDGEKLGDDPILWQALAPFVNHQASIECRGEDGALWKWVFKGGVFKELEGKVTYR